MTKKKETEHSTGQMEENTKDNGRMENSMVLEYTHRHLERQRRDNGLKAKELLGFSEIMIRKECVTLRWFNIEDNIYIEIQLNLKYQWRMLICQLLVIH